MSLFVCHDCRYQEYRNVFVHIGLECPGKENLLTKAYDIPREAMTGLVDG